jgi:molybdopterin converting factor subunit 1
MKVRVRLFALYRELAGTGITVIELRDNAKVKDVKPALYKKFPALKKHDRNIVFAVNNSYAFPGAPLGNGDVVALIPPVSGG